MAVDTCTMIHFQSGEMSEREIVEMLSEMISVGNIDNEDPLFSKLARRYIKDEVMDDEGNINYIKLKE